MREDMPTLRGRWFNVALCCDCWNRLNPDRAMEPERQRSTEALIVKTFADAEKDAIRDNCCAACEEVPHAGIYVRTTVEALRKMRPT